MRVAFRVDGNNKIGIGHIMRCLSLADAFAQHDVHVEFVLSDTIMQEIVERRGYSTYLLNSRWDDYSYGLSEFRTLLVDHSINWVITDSYYAQQEYFAEIHDFCKTAIISEGVPAAFFSFNTFLPCSESRFAASASLNPSSVALSALSTSSDVFACQGTRLFPSCPSILTPYFV